jgi:hypothetical protein
MHSSCASTVLKKLALEVLNTCRLMKGLLLVLALLAFPAVVFGQLGEVEEFRSEASTVLDALSDIKKSIAEYEALFEHRSMLQIWINDERGVKRETATPPRPHATYLRARSAVEAAEEELKSMPGPVKLGELRRRLAARLHGLREGMAVERSDIEALSVQLESLRNEDVPPLG